MGRAEVLERIAAWEAGGVIDGETAKRLRAVEAEAGVKGAQALSSAPAQALSVTELFGYLGALFVISAWHWMVWQASGEGVETLVMALGAAAASAALASLGYVLHRRGAAWRRAAAMSLLGAGSELGAAAYLAVTELLPDAGPTGPLVASLIWLLGALALRRGLASVPTQVGLLTAGVAAAAAVVGWADPILFGQMDPELVSDGPPAGIPLRTLLAVGWWWAVAGAMGYLAEREARWNEPSARWRVALTRSWAALTAVLSTTATALVIGAGVGAPLLGDLLLLVLAGVLVAAAARTGANAYLYPAGLALLIALTDFNGRVIGPALGLGAVLLLEGACLLAIALAIQMLRRRLARPPSGDPDIEGPAATDEPAAPMETSVPTKPSSD